MMSSAPVRSLACAVIGAALVAACGGGTTPDPFQLCGNGVINPGEQCDDGDSNSDFGACLTTCQTAYCGDGWIYAAQEQCDKNNFGYPDPRDPQTCTKLGFDGGTLLCTAGCRFDTAGCGPTFTPVATVVQTLTPSSTSTPTPGTSCGNGLIEAGETCEQCPADCRVQPCTPSATQAFYTVSFAPPAGQDATSVTVLVGYRSSVLSIPGSGTSACMGGSNDGHACGSNANCPGGQCVPRNRVTNTPPGSIVGVNDLNYALRVVITRSPQIPPGALFTVDFDTCTGAVATSSDVSCSIPASGCAGLFGPIDGCTCTVSGPASAP